MAKHTTLLFLFSLLVVLFHQSVQFILLYISLAYHALDATLSPYFADSVSGDLLRQFFLLNLLPLVISLCIAKLYFIVTKRNLSYFYTLLWSIWTVILVTFILA